MSSVIAGAREFYEFQECCHQGKLENNMSSVFAHQAKLGVFMSFDNAGIRGRWKVL